MNVAAFLHRSARLWPDRPALALGAATVATYRDMAARSAALAGALRHRLGLAPGDRVAIVMNNCPDYMIAKYAIWQAGLCAVPVNAKLHRKEFQFILENSGAKALFVDAAMETALAGIAGEVPGLAHVISVASAEWKKLLGHEPIAMSEVAPEDPAWLFYTSGTTGRPKGATLTHRNLVAMTMNYFADVDAVAPVDCIIHAAPMSHGSGIYAMPHVARGASNVTPESGHFDPAETVELVNRLPGASFFFAPTMIVRLLQSHALDLLRRDNLKTIVYGGGPMYVADLLKGIEQLGQKFVQIYGQGESPMTITGLTREHHMETDHPRYLERMGSVGVARTDVEVRVVDGEDRELPPGEIGEIVCRGDVVMKGYWNNPDASAKALAGGWLHTGDVGAFDADGFLTLKDRSKDMIISGGSNIYPREIEEVLLKHPGVLECSVIGRPHPDWGEEVLAFVVAKPEAKLDDAALDKLCLDNIARFKRPKGYRFVAALPKNNYGKVLKTELREWAKKEPA
ncbi:MAG: AMP-binding protein [Rhodospirillaceae bacterium]|nr:AMP-binding protein [Rhodospirillaceae bacterium]